MKLAFSAFIFSLSVASQTLAFSISPAIVDIKPSGKDSTTTVVVSNPDNEEVDLAVYMNRRTSDEFGKESREDFDVKHNFLILPTTALLKPKSSIAVRIVYIGTHDVKEEQAYRVIFANLKPHKLAEGSGSRGMSISALFSYAASLYIEPNDKKAELRIEGKKTVGGKNYFVLKNEGDRRIKLSEQIIKVSADGLAEPERFHAQDFQGLDSPIFAHQTRLVQLPKASKADPSKAKLDLGDWR